MFRIVGQDMIELSAGVQSSELSRLRVGMPAKVHVVGLGDLDGSVSSLAGGVDATTQSGTASIVVPDGRLRVGAFAHAYIDAGEVCALTVPLSALLTGPDGTAVEIVRSNRVETRRVSVGLLGNRTMPKSAKAFAKAIRSWREPGPSCATETPSGPFPRPAPVRGSSDALGSNRTADRRDHGGAGNARSVAAEAPCHAARLALVIGNASYADSDAPLREPIGDAREFADAVQRLGFATTEAENLTQDRMRSVIEAFEQKVTERCRRPGVLHRLRHPELEAIPI